MKRRSAILGCAMMFVLAPIGALAQEATAPGLEISGGFMRASPMVAAAGAGFMTIRSTGPEDRLVAFSSPACTQPELHTGEIVGVGQGKKRHIQPSHRASLAIEHTQARASDLL